MATLGLILLWGGYTFGIYGFNKIKSAYGGAPDLSLSDLALPSHRTTYITAAQQWATSSVDAANAAAAGDAAGEVANDKAAAAAVAGTPAGAINPLGGAGSTPSGPVAAGATGTAALGRTPPVPSPTRATSGPFVPAT